MSGEADFIDLLRSFATHPAARGLIDDAAVLDVGGVRLVLTHDMIVDGVHYLPADPPEDVAWKLVAVNLSDLAAKGAEPLAALLGYGLGDAEWDGRFAEGLRATLDGFCMALIGGDTVAMPVRAMGLTAIGTSEHAPSRSGAQPGDDLWVSGSIGDAGAGLAIARGADGPDNLLQRYRRPYPRLELGQALAPVVHAMMDVSDGLLIDAARMAAASRVAIAVDLEHVPLSPDLVAFAGDDRAARLAAATAGDDYELLFAAAAADRHVVVRLSEETGVSLTRIGAVSEGENLSISHNGEAVPLPEKLGYRHG
ncbi:thiamine-phosphate kinase [Allosphingosinicella indica]|uniref:Thiamine-monophosphate kinase n=1 Tax=Allosphingosinicella indica TaxID=941907 RepID=A0A1X7G091_9SPHN|nr:thiamine-phosphate kinase [Allosphingosinicella indica]SMF61800.1 thiamine-phosphate kinase [Allosphingosinicella indica]